MNRLIPETWNGLKMRSPGRSTLLWAIPSTASIHQIVYKSRPSVVLYYGHQSDNVVSSGLYSQAGDHLSL